MIYLALTLIGSCFISYGFKLASIKKTDQDYIVFLNYFTAFLGMAIYCAATGNIEVSGLKNGPMLMLAIFLMLFMFGNLVGNNASTDRNGINNTTFFNRIGFLPCILLSAIIWMDIPGILSFHQILQFFRILFYQKNFCSCSSCFPIQP